MKNEPVLSNAKTGDKLFSPIYGYVEVVYNFGKSDQQPFGFIYMKEFNSCNHFGRQPDFTESTKDELHPRFFLNLGECVKYYSELYLLTLNKEEKND